MASICRHPFVRLTGPVANVTNENSRTVQFMKSIICELIQPGRNHLGGQICTNIQLRKLIGSHRHRNIDKPKFVTNLKQKFS